MKISSVSVKGLFGIFDHNIRLKTEDRITIILGPNGFGKTILLNMISGFFERNYGIFRRVPFAEFEIEFDDGSTARILSKAKPNGQPTRIENQIEIEYIDSKRKKHNIKPTEERTRGIHIYPEFVEDSLPFLRRIGPRRWRDVRTDEVLEYYEVRERYGEMFIGTTASKDEWLKELTSSINIRLLGDQRLLRQSRDDDGKALLRPAVSNYSKELSDTIKSTLAIYAEQSQALDRSFPFRLVQLKKSGGIRSDKLKVQLNQLEERRLRFVEAGLLDKQVEEGAIPSTIAPDKKQVLAVYIEDVGKKLGSLNEIASKLDLIKNIINKRFLYKKLEIDKEKGFMFSSIKGKAISPSDLSSGEQQELVLLYELLFKTKPNTLFLIDEPELSLHVVWQREFLTDLQDIAKLSSFDVILATHSNQIINDRWDLTVELKGP